ncbi:Thioredoxin/protein disulfide isomerase [Handroanthus impetiginosus]|uniref:protein disulfide-isomerase n=1 Tax=Handroanthus impetiginosus TaxID=429701 RepID=A0A2G9GV23_9LAMI|nr:Thioredoxin/protein disulfide isomerase [Handroanthus impetiginosus]
MEKSPLVPLLLFSLIGNFGVYALYGPSSPVVQLNPNNFKSKVLNSNGVVLVEFFAPWCGHCQALTPTWEKAANVLKGVATVAALDADAHQSLAQEYGIRGFPTIKVFVPGKPPVDYQGARDVKPIVEFALQQVKALLKERLDGKSAGGSSQKSEPSASVELNSRNFDELVLKSKELWIVEFFAPWCGHCKKLAPEWKKAANSLKGQVKFGHVDCDAEKSLMSRFNVQGFPTILVFGADKDSPFPYEGARSASAIESFALEQLEANAAPPEVTELSSPDVLEEKCGSAAICFVAFLPDILDSKAEGRNKYLELLLSVAEKFKKSPYSYLWAAAGNQPDLEKHVGVGGYGYPALVALNLKKKAYAPLKSAFEFDQIIEFVKEAGRGGKGTLPLEGSPTIQKTEPWDGKDGQIIEEDEFSLEELMGDDSASKDEL